MYVSNEELFDGILDSMYCQRTARSIRSRVFKKLEENKVQEENIWPLAVSYLEEVVEEEAHVYRNLFTNKFNKDKIDLKHMTRCLTEASHDIDRRKCPDMVSYWMIACEYACIKN